MAHLRAGAIYDPAGQGSIASIGYSYDAIHLNPPPGIGGRLFFGAVAVSKLNPRGSELVYSTFFGGTGMDIGHDIAVDSNGNAYVAGETDSTDFPSIGAFQPMNGGPVQRYP